jgi:hypothetical protein
MLESILMVTMLVTNLSVTEQAYDDYLGYDTVVEGNVNENLAFAWDAEDMINHPYIIMQPESGEDVYLRFIEDQERTNYKPVGTHGWNSTEILVEDPDKLADELDNSPFEIIGMPYDLYPTPNAPRAMQVLGPSDEMIYLTRIIPDGSGYNLGSAKSYVDRVFIMVVGGPSMEDLQEYYRETFDMPVTEASDWTIGVISRLNDLPEDTLYPLAIAEFDKDFLIELDEYPDSIVSREIADGHLPPSTSVVSFFVDSLDAIDVTWREKPTAIEAFPYNGRKVGVTVGVAGEWIELVEK